MLCRIPKPFIHTRVEPPPYHAQARARHLARRETCRHGKRMPPLLHRTRPGIHSSHSSRSSRSQALMRFLRRHRVSSRHAAAGAERAAPPAVAAAAAAETWTLVGMPPPPPLPPPGRRRLVVVRTLHGRWRRAARLRRRCAGRWGWCGGRVWLCTTAGTRGGWWWSMPMAGSWCTRVSSCTVRTCVCPAWPRAACAPACVLRKYSVVNRGDWSIVASGQSGFVTLPRHLTAICSELVLVACIGHIALFTRHPPAARTAPDAGDTRPCPALVAAGRGATLLIHEATFEPCLEQQARGKRHSTSAEAAAVAAAMRAYRYMCARAHACMRAWAACGHGHMGIGVVRV